MADYLAASGLATAAGAGNALAIDTLIGLSASTTNASVQRAVLAGLQQAAANQNPRAIEALRSRAGP